MGNYTRIGIVGRNFFFIPPFGIKIITWGIISFKSNLKGYLSNLKLTTHNLELTFTP
jgi:hypothetical protein